MIPNVWRIKTTTYNKNNPDWLLEVLAKNRNLKNQKEIDDYLNPTIKQILDVPVSDEDIAIKRITEAIKNKQKIIVYSDYDADGITATAIMWETLNDLGASVMPYVPHRIKEGYGLAIEAIEKLASEGVNLIITVDNGVTAVDQVKRANELGVDVIVTDHHVLPKDLPKAFAMVHTTALCGAGVAWRLCYDLVEKFKPNYKEKMMEKLELAAIATVADLVPLNGPCRSIVKFGLEYLNKTKRPGIKALITASNLNSEIGTYEIGHILAPRINAMGRIEHGLDSLRLICAKNRDQAQKLASLLSKTNNKRKDLTTDAISSAYNLVDTTQLVGVISHQSWHEGVIGLVASRLVETHHKPMIVISRGEIFSKGSARSIPGFNIVEAIRNSSEFLTDAGGHPMAAGFTIHTKHIDAFSKKINVYAQTTLTEEILTPVINVECKIESADVNVHNFKIIKKLEPYGMGNPEPVFLTRKMTIEDVRSVGPTSQHLKLQLGGHSAIAFNKGNLMSSLRPGYLVDVVYTIAEDKYAGNGSLQMKVKDLELKD